MNGTAQTANAASRPQNPASPPASSDVVGAAPQHVGGGKLGRRPRQLGQQPGLRGLVCGAGDREQRGEDEHTRERAIRRDRRRDRRQRRAAQDKARAEHHAAGATVCQQRDRRRSEGGWQQPHQRRDADGPGAALLVGVEGEQDRERPGPQSGGQPHHENAPDTDVAERRAQ
jgi:hypothetical protein